MTSELKGSQGIFLFLETFLKLIRKQCPEPIILMISEPDGSAGIFPFLVYVYIRDKCIHIYIYIHIICIHPPETGGVEFLDRACSVGGFGGSGGGFF